MHFLLISSGTGNPSTFELVGEKTIIGRHPNCDLVLNDPTISKRHCVITFHQDDLVLIDGDMNKPSTNGVFVNRIQVKHKQILKNNDVIQVGPFSLKVQKQVEVAQGSADDFDTIDKTVLTPSSFPDTPPPPGAVPQEVEVVADFQDDFEDTGWDVQKGAESTDMVEIESTEVGSPKMSDTQNIEPVSTPQEFTNEETTNLLEGGRKHEPLLEDYVGENFVEVNDEENNYKQKFSLTRKTLNIGNRKNPDNHIGLMDSFVSKIHGRIFYDEARRLYFFEDLGSRNGSWINGNLMTKNAPQIVSNGDRLRVGKTRIRVTLSQT